MNHKCIQSALRERYGNFETLLEHEYEKVITEVFMNGEVSAKDEWATYNQVMLELKNNVRDVVLLKELQYRLTDNENPNLVCIDVIEKTETHSNELIRLYKKIISFIEYPK